MAASSACSSVVAHVLAQKASPSGELIGDSIQISENGRDRLWTVMAVASTEGLAVLWEAFDAEDQSLGMLKREFDVDGVPTGPEEWFP
jgi:hypothetical protein